MPTNNGVGGEWGKPVWNDPWVWNGGSCLENDDVTFFPISKFSKGVVMFIGLFILILQVLCLLAGPAIACNSAKALRKGEGMYDRESTEIMTAGGWFGIAFGIAITYWGFTGLFGRFLW